MSSRLTSSPSPTINKSKKSARGSGLQTHGPPATTIGAKLSPRSAACRGIPARSSILRILVKESSYCNVKPTISNSLTGSRLSSAYSGIWCSRISASKSAQGANTRSHQYSFRAFVAPYRIFIPKWDMPISYVSGKQNANRTATCDLSFTILPTSPPIYCAGFCT